MSKSKSPNLDTILHSLTVLCGADLRRINATKTEAKQAILEWALSCIPEKRDYAPKLSYLDPDDPTTYNAISFGSNEAIDQTIANLKQSA